MLTYPSDSLPQIVCPMDEDAIPPNPFCSAPPHSEPPPPLFPISSITPSFANDGHRRSGRIQGNRAQTPKEPNDSGSGETENPSRHNPSPTKRQREMVSQSKQPRVESTYVQERENEDGFDFNFAAEHQNEQKERKSPRKKQRVSAAEEDDVAEQVDEDEEDGATPNPNMDMCGGLAVGHAVGHAVDNVSPPKGWVIGPLIQTFRSKMASFTEIVMSPVKLFKANSPPLSTEHLDGLGEGELRANGTAEEEEEEEAVGRHENGAGAYEPSFSDGDGSRQNVRNGALKYSKKLAFDPSDECGLTQRGGNSLDPVPSRDVPSLIGSSAPFQPPVAPSASDESRTKTEEEEEEVRVRQAVRLKPLPRKRTGNRSESKRVTPRAPVCEVVKVEGGAEVSQRDSNNETQTPPVCYTQLGADRLQPGDGDGTETESCGLVRQSLWSNRANGDTQTHPDPHPAAGLGRSKRGPKPSREPAKRKKVTACSEETENRELKEPKPLRKKTAASANSTKFDREEEEEAEVAKPVRKRQASRKGKSGAEVNGGEEALILEISPESDPRARPSKRPKARTARGKAEVTVESMDLETTLALTSVHRPEEKPPQRKPAKRKSPVQAAAESDAGTLVSSSSDVPGSNPRANQAPKRSRKAARGAPKSSEPAAPPARGPPREEEETGRRVDGPPPVTKDGQCKDGRGGGASADPVYFEMTPFGGDPPAPPPPPRLECWTSQLDEAASRPRSRRVRPQRRRCRVLHQRQEEEEEEEEAPTTSVTMEDADLAGTGGGASSSSRRLLRSYSCPEIPSLRPHDGPWAVATATTPTTTTTTPPVTVTPHHGRAPHSSHAHRSLRRARRHTVCSVEVEREIAPLCLRKEVYPSRRSLPSYEGPAHLHPSPTLALSPSSSLSALASCFLSSPLAFLSKKPEAPGTSHHASSPSSSSSFLSSPLSSSAWHLPGFLQRGDSSRGASDSSSSGDPLACEAETKRQSEEEEEEDDDDDCEDTSSSSQEFEDMALREEKALSDSEIKVVQKHEERGKVSSIRIRKTLPKPQNNLTPMGLPKPVRLKKKEFSLEEIYTNKNFSKPPESRLETIFEVPLNRRNGSESWFGQRRVKRFLEFLEVGEVRKPKKPLVGAGKAAAPSSRTRRGGFAKDEPAQDVDSLLCAKLDQLNLWLVTDQTDS